MLANPLEQEPQHSPAEYRGARTRQPEHGEEQRMDHAQLEPAAHEEQNKSSERSCLQNVEGFGTLARKPLGFVQAKIGKQRMPKQEQTRKEREVAHRDPHGQEIGERGGADLA